MKIIDVLNNVTVYGSDTSMDVDSVTTFSNGTLEFVFMGDKDTIKKIVSRLSYGEDLKGHVISGVFLKDGNTVLCLEEEEKDEI